VRRLEAPDGPAELHPARHVLGGHAQRAVRDADLQSAKPRDREVDAAREVGRGRGAAQDVFLGDRGAVEFDAEPRLAVRGLLAFERHAGDVGVEQEHAELSSRIPRRHHDARREVRDRHRGLHAVQAIARAIGAGERRGSRRIVAQRLLEPAREEHLARGDPRQPALLLRLRAELSQRKGAERQHGPQRNRGHSPSRLLEQHTQPEQPEAASAHGIRERRADQVGLRELRPEIGVDAHVADLDLLQPVGGRAVLEDLPR